MTTLTRRDVLKLGAQGTVLLIVTWPRRAAGLPPVVVFIGGLVLGEVILGVLRAYDIDIGKTTEEIVRSFRDHNYRQGIRTNERRPRTRMISHVGLSPSGYLQVGRRGVIAGRKARRSEPEGYWVPGELLFVAADPDRASDRYDLDACRCGYPSGPFVWTRDEDKDYVKVTQRFEEGEAGAVIDRTKLPRGSHAIEGPPRDIILDMSWKVAGA